MDPCEPGHPVLAEHPCPYTTLLDEDWTEIGCVCCAACEALCLAMIPPSDYRPVRTSKRRAFRAALRGRRTRRLHA